MVAIGAVTKVARRSLLRDRWRALLIIVLIGLPVMGITTATLLLQAVVPTPEECAISIMGQADLRAIPDGPFGRAELLSILPRGSTVEAVMWGDRDRLLLPGTRTHAEVRHADLEGLAAGMLTMLEGSQPTAPGDVAISTALSRRSGTGIGETLELENLGSVRVVGLLEDPRDLGRDVVLGPADRAEAGGEDSVWLVDLPPRADARAVARTLRSTPARERRGAATFEVMTRESAGRASETFVALAVMLGSLALVEAALVASAAFAVGIRRRQRELGLLGAAGASPRQLAGTVLVEGLLAGLVAVVGGVAMGIAAAWLIGLRLDDLAGRRVGSIEIDPLVLIVAALIGLLATLIAGAVPAWGASRLPTMVALSGRRPPSTPATRLLGLGLGLLVIALLCSIGAPLLGSSMGDYLPLVLLAVGAIAGVLGFGACSPWLLERLEGPARRLPLATRVAFRDTARARTRNGPIVAAVLASVGATIALAAIFASQQANAEQHWRPQMATDSMIVRSSEPGTGARVAQEMGAVGWGQERWALLDGWDVYVVMPLREPDPERSEFTDNEFSTIVGDEALLHAFHGESAIQAFRDGAVVVLESPYQRVRGSTARVVQSSDDGQARLGQVDVAVIPLRDDGSSPDEFRSSRAIMSPATARALGVEAETGPVQVVVRLDHDVTAADMEAAARVASTADPDAYVQGPLMLPDPLLPFRMLALGASLIAALTITGVAVALGEAESRSEQRTLLALGAPRGLRRRITASRGLVIAILAGALAIPAGLLPVWGVLFQRGWPIVVPLPEVVGALLVLPLAAMAGGLLLGRPLPEWSARRDPRT